MFSLTNIIDVIKEYRRIILFVLRVVLAVVIIYWLFAQNKENLASLENLDFNFHTISLLAFSQLLILLGLMTISLRQMLFLRSIGLVLSYVRILRIVFVSSFLGILLPGLIGGDAVKAVYFCANAPTKKSDALSSIFIDRFIGIFSLLLIGAVSSMIAIILFPGKIDVFLLLQAPIVVLIICLGLVCFSLDGFYNLGPIQKILGFLPVRLVNLINSIRTFIKDRNLLVRTLFLSVINHSFVIVSFIAAAFMLKDQLPIGVHFVLNPLAMFMNIVPVTPGGIGIAEGAFSYLFGLLHSQNGAMIGLLGRIIQYSVIISSGSLIFTFLSWKEAEPQETDIQSAG